MTTGNILGLIPASLEVLGTVSQAARLDRSPLEESSALSSFGLDVVAGVCEPQPGQADQASDERAGELDHCSVDGIERGV